MSIAGYAGSILYIDLTRKETIREALQPELTRSLIGGFGINNRLAYDLMTPGVDALSPKNPIIFGAGPFAGTLIPGASKIFATTKFPLNGAIATASAGGTFALMLKSTGYDHVVISGRSEWPVFLRISEDDVEFCDAEKLWGMDTFDTTDRLRSRYEPCSIISIGQAGENLVIDSVASVDKVATLGRGGLPAVMGSKNLKAIVVQQGTNGIKIADRRTLLRLVSNLYERIMKWPGRQFILDNGLADLPPSLIELHRRMRRPLACPGCPIADKEVVMLSDGPYSGLKTYMSSVSMHQFDSPYIASVGVPQRFDDRSETEIYEQSIKYLDTLNRYGLCRTNFSSLFSTMVHLYHNGVITKEDTGGIEIKGDIETILELARLTAYREGFGKVLADGLAGFAKKIGKGAEDLIEHIKGHALIFDPRLNGLGTMEFEEIVTPRGANVAAAGSPSYQSGRPPTDFARHGERMGIPEEALKRVVGSTSFNPGRFSRYSEDWYSLFSCLSLCNRAQINRFYHVKTIAELFTAVTGIDLAPAQLMKASEQAWTIGKLLNAREGFDRKDDKVPEAWFRPLVVEGKEYHLTDYYKTSILTKEDMERYLDDYYDERGYDKKSGLPSREKLSEFGLE